MMYVYLQVFIYRWGIFVDLIDDWIKNEKN